MIVVVADDLTGSAELAGVGLHFSLKSEVQTGFSGKTNADLLIIDTHTRSLKPNAVASQIQALLGHLRNVEPEWIYKKTDSVLRGHVLLELEKLLTGLKLNGALLVPANPSKERIIAHGTYFIHGKPLHKTDFANDPEFPIVTSNVLQLLGHSCLFDTLYLEPPKALPEKSIVIAAAEDREDLRHWALCVDKNILPAGGADFFESILKAQGMKREKDTLSNNVPGDKITLFVSGSSSQQSYDVVEQLKIKDFPVCELPCPITNPDAMNSLCLQTWIQNVLNAFTRNNKVFACIHQPALQNAELSSMIVEFIAKMVGQILKKVEIEELIFEGGATASAILRRLNWRRLVPVQELAPGVVRMKVLSHSRQFVTLKPGSYPWPEAMWYCN